MYLDHVGKDTFYEDLLASLPFKPTVPRRRFRRVLLRLTMGAAMTGACRPLPGDGGHRAAGVQTHDKVSDAEAKARADFDIRWKVSLGNRD